MCDYRKTFYSETRARAFADYLIKTYGVEDIGIVYNHDAFGQKTYTVEWNLD